jgi:hypothetical protein
VDERPTLLPLDPPHLGECVVDVVDEDHLGAVGQATGDPRRVGVLRHHDLGAGAHHAGGVPDRHGVVAGADRADAAAQLVRGQGHHVDQGAARLEAAGILEELQLEPHLGGFPQETVEPVAAHPPDRGAAHALAQTLAGGADLVERRGPFELRWGLFAHFESGSSRPDSIAPRPSLRSERSLCGSSQAGRRRPG